MGVLPSYVLVSKTPTPWDNTPITGYLARHCDKNSWIIIYEISNSIQT